MTPATALAYRIGAAARRPASWLQLLKFGLVGCSGYVINLGVFIVLADSVEARHSLAAVGAFCVAVTNNFLWNRHWTFDASEDRAGFQAVRFLVVSVAALIVNLAVLEALVAGAELGSVVSQAIAVAVAMPFNFIGNKLWTFAS
ncbi:MAG TPA: GtrA family protein [Solirubrobacterales bacterium]|nr:GtrA family protein [Solirubrobacterales bacterium]